MSVRTTPARRPALLLLVALAACGPFTLNILIPSMPRLAQDFSTEYSTAQLILTVYLVGIAVSQLIYGPVSDRIGRRPALMAGLALFAVGSGLSLLADSIEVLILARGIQALGASAGMSLGRAMVRDVWGREQSASVIGYVTMGMAVAPMVAPALGGYIEIWFGWRTSLAVVGVYAALLFAWAAWALPETLRVAADSPKQSLALRSYMRLLGSPLFLAYSFGSAFASATFFAFLGGAPYITIQLMGLPASEYGLYFILVSVGYILGNFLAGRFSVGVGIDRMAIAGAALAVGGGAFLAAGFLGGPLSPLLLFGCMAIIAIGNGMSLPNGVAGAISVDVNLAGTASGLSGFLQMGLGGAASQLVGLLQTDSAAPTIVVMAISTLLSLLAYLMATRYGKRG
jgi:MFS transporter, DHA1 family, multidrug resistance protein